MGNATWRFSKFEGYFLTSLKERWKYLQTYVIAMHKHTTRTPIYSTQNFRYQTFKVRTNYFKSVHQMKLMTANVYDTDFSYIYVQNTEDFCQKRHMVIERFRSFKDD